MKNNLNLLIDYSSEDEVDIVEWSNDCDAIVNKLNIFNCGCCEDCLCSDEQACSNCLCECSLDFDENDNNKDIDVNTDFDIVIVQDQTKEKKVRITLELNVMLNNNNKIISVDLDINQLTYLKIAEELFKI